MTKDDALKMVAQAIEQGWSFDRIDAEVYPIVQKALEQPETGMLHIDRLDQWLDASLKERKHRAWVDLTDEEMWNAPTGGSDIINLDYARNVLALAKEKNT